jgi:hypothetical protein
MMVEEDDGAGPSLCLSDWRLDRLLAGELEPAARAGAEQHLAGCGACAARRGDREAEQRLFRDTAPPLFLRAVAPRRRRQVWWLGAAAAAAAAVVVVVLLLGRTPREELVALKGRPHLRFFVRDGATGTVREGLPGQQVHPGDRLRFGFDGDLLTRTPLLRVALLNREASGKVTRYFPEGGAAAAALPPVGRDGLLPFSILLDEVLGPETIFALYCREPVSLPALEGALARGGALPPWPPACEVETVRLEKTRRR